MNDKSKSTVSLVKNPPLAADNVLPRKQRIRNFINDSIEIYWEFAKQHPIFIFYLTVITLLQIHLDLLIPSVNVSLSSIDDRYIIPLPFNLKGALLFADMFPVLLLSILFIIPLFNMLEDGKFESKKLLVFLLFKLVIITNYSLYFVLILDFCFFVGAMLFWANFSELTFWGLDPQRIADFFVQEHPITILSYFLLNLLAMIVSLKIIRVVSHLDSGKIVRFFELKEES